MSPRCTLLVLVAGCSSRSLVPMQDASAGTVMVSFAGLPPPPSGPLALASASLRLKDVSLYGDVQTAPGFQLGNVSVDALATPAPVRVSGLPQGVYSRLEFSIESLEVSGQWRERTLHLSLADDDGDDDEVGVNLRSAQGLELAAGETVEFAVIFDVSSWFAAVDLDLAEVDDQTIQLDDNHNSVLTAAIVAAVPPSFELTTPTP